MTVLPEDECTVYAVLTPEEVAELEVLISAGALDMQLRGGYPAPVLPTSYPLARRAASALGLDVAAFRCDAV